MQSPRETSKFHSYHKNVSLLMKRVFWRKYYSRIQKQKKVEVWLSYQSGLLSSYESGFLDERRQPERRTSDAYQRVACGGGYRSPTPYTPDCPAAAASDPFDQSFCYAMTYPFSSLGLAYAAIKKHRCPEAFQAPSKVDPFKGHKNRNTTLTSAMLQTFMETAFRTPCTSREMLTLPVMGNYLFPICSFVGKLSDQPLSPPRTIDPAWLSVSTGGERMETPPRIAIKATVQQLRHPLHRHVPYLVIDQI